MKIIDDTIEKLKQASAGFSKLSWTDKIFLAICLYILYKIVSKMLRDEENQ